MPQKVWPAPPGVNAALPAGARDFSTPWKTFFHGVEKLARGSRRAVGCLAEPKNQEACMKAVVVYESLWGNTAAVARAIAEGLGPDVRALSTAEAPPALLEGVDLIVAGSPLFAFRLPTDAIRETIRRKSASFPRPPDLSHPALRTWLEALPAGRGRGAAFETRMWFSPGGATGDILASLKHAGYLPLARGQRFRVTGMYGPLKAGELERARIWGAKLARGMQS